MGAGPGPGMAGAMYAPGPPVGTVPGFAAALAGTHSVPGGKRETFCFPAGFFAPACAGAEQGRLPGLLPGGRGDADGPERSEWFLPEFIIFFSKIGVGRIDGLCLLLSQGDKLRPQIGQTGAEIGRASCRERV